MGKKEELGIPNEKSMELTDEESAAVAGGITRDELDGLTIGTRVCIISGMCRGRHGEICRFDMDRLRKIRQAAEVRLDDGTVSLFIPSEFVLE